MIEVRHQAEIPGAIHQAFRLARSGEPGPVAVVIPYPLYHEVWDYDQPVPPPYPAAVRRGRLSAGRSPPGRPSAASRDLRRDWAASTPAPR